MMLIGAPLGWWEVEPFFYIMSNAILARTMIRIIRFLPSIDGIL